MVIAMRRHSWRQCLMRAMANGWRRAVDDGRDGLPDPFGRSLDLPIPDMGVSHGHAGLHRTGLRQVPRCLAPAGSARAARKARR